MESAMYYLARYLDHLQAEVYATAEDHQIPAEDVCHMVETGVEEMEEIERAMDRSE